MPGRSSLAAERAEAAEAAASTDWRAASAGRHCVVIVGTGDDVGVEIAEKLLVHSQTLEWGGSDMERSTSRSAVLTGGVGRTMMLQQILMVRSRSA